MESHERALEVAEDAARILGLLAEPERLRVAAAVVLGYTRIDEIAKVSGVPRRDVEGAVARLIAGGLLEQDGRGYRFAVEELKGAARRVADARPREDVVAPADQARILRSFVKGGRVSSIPATRSKRRVLLDHLAQDFEPGRRYTETEVNRTLGRWHDDVAALRRYMVDECFMARGEGHYWRIGGTVEID